MRTSLPLFRYLFDKTTDILIFISNFVKINITTKIILVYSYCLYIIDAISIIKYIYNYLLLTISSNLLLIILSSLLPLVVNLINGILYLDRILFFNISLSFCLLSFL